jgi:flagellar biosynthesis/type III secretory pathway protein FliH
MILSKLGAQVIISTAGKLARRAGRAIKNQKKGYRRGYEKGFKDGLAKARKELK